MRETHARCVRLGRFEGLETEAPSGVRGRVPVRYAADELQSQIYNLQN